MRDFSIIGKDAGGGEGDRCNYPYRLDTYGAGCQHDCSYCYAKSLLEFRQLWDPKHPAVAPIKDISRAVRKLKPGDIVRLGGMTDCFQPCERIYRNTYKTIMLLNRRKIGYLIVTKSAMVAEYADIMDKGLAHIQVTVTTLDDKLASTYEKASPPSERIKAILKLQKQGFDVQLRLSPYIPEYVDTVKLGGARNRQNLRRVPAGEHLDKEVVRHQLCRLYGKKRRISAPAAEEENRVYKQADRVQRADRLRG